MQALYLREGRIEAMRRPYAIPLPVVLDGAYYVVPSGEALECVFRSKYEGVRQAGIEYLRASVVEHRATSRQRCTALVDWYYIDRSGGRAGRTTARYFLNRRDGEITVSMIEFLHLAFPSIRTWFAQESRSATRREMLTAQQRFRH